jgi:hypothetical protein
VDYVLDLGGEGSSERIQYDDKAPRYAEIAYSLPAHGASTGGGSLVSSLATELYRTSMGLPLLLDDSGTRRTIILLL